MPTVLDNFIVAARNQANGLGHRMGPIPSLPDAHPCPLNMPTLWPERDGQYPAWYTDGRQGVDLPLWRGAKE